MDSDQPEQTPSPAKPASARPDDAALPPTPVREAMDLGEPEPDAVERDLEEVSLEVDGTEWTARVLGRSRGGPPTAPTDLLLLGFASPGEDSATLECLVVGRLLSGLSELQLLSALRGATPPLDPDRPKTLFPGTAERRKGRN